MNLAEHYPVLPVVLPLLAAPILAMVQIRALAWSLTVIVCWLSFGFAILLMEQAMTEGVISYALGGWEPPWGIEYRVDALNAFVILLISGIGAILSIYAKRSVEDEIDPEKHVLFYTMFMLVQAGLIGIAVTGDAFNAFVFLEISSLSTYAMVAMGRDKRALVSAYQYLIMGTIGATFYLIGVGLLYQMTGTLNMADLAVRLQDVEGSRPVIAGFGFIAVGLMIKVALFPLHQWLPNAYAHAPSVVTAFLAATATKVSLYLIIRFGLTVFGHEYTFVELPLGNVLAVLAILGMFVASMIALFQTDMKRMLAYSSVAQIGYMLLGFSLGTVGGVTASVIHLFNHAIMKAALFMALGVVIYRLGGATIHHMSGLAQRMPYTAFGIAMGGLSLIGVPLTVGFISKWTLVDAALDEGQWLITVAILGSSLIAIAYVWRLVETMYFQPTKCADAGRSVPWMMLAPMWLLLAANFYFGIVTDYSLGTADIAARSLLDTWE